MRVARPLIGILILGVVSVSCLSDDPIPGDATSTGDFIPPIIVSTFPEDQGFNVPVQTVITAVFDEEIRASTVRLDTFFVSQSGINIGGVVGLTDCCTITFTPTLDLGFSTPYSATITVGVTDLAGNALTEDLIWDFTTTTGIAITDGAISAGDNHTLALSGDGTVWAWGSNTFFQLGNSGGSRAFPVAVSSLNNAMAIAAGHSDAGIYHSMAVTIDGVVFTWGGNSNGQLGDGGFLNRATPLPVAGLPLASAASVGGLHSLAVGSDGTVWAWGENENGQLGDGSFTDSALPVQAQLSMGVNAVSIASGSSHSAALADDGTVWSWGFNGDGRLGDGTFDLNPPFGKSFPVQVLVSNITAIAAGDGHTLALTTTGEVWSWGKNNAGQLGNGDTLIQAIPVQVQGLTGIVAIAAGFNHSLAVKGDGTVWAWGENQNGQLGDGCLFGVDCLEQHNPIQVLNLLNVVSVSGGGFHSLALRSDGTLWVWGRNDDGLGDGTSVISTVPIWISTLTL